ncbi:MAG TPA: ABC transporter transmembrane domain-containing protein [Gammaproteobacteria bacterium]|nr:ABC transporter transmembrane domain-containing protein [Gammaproteobacteria bacterium]
MSAPLPRIPSLVLLRRLGALLQPYRWRVMLAVTALIIAAAGVLGLGQGVRLMVDRGLGGGAPEDLDQALALGLGIVIVMALATGLRFYLVSWIGERLATDLRRQVFAHVLRLDVAFFEQQRVGEVASRITTDTTLLETVFGSSLSIAVRNTLLLLGGLGMLLVTSSRLGLMVLLGAPLVALPVLWFGRRVRRLSRRSQDRVADASSYVDETLHAIRTVKACDHEAVDEARFGAIAERAFATAARRVRQRALLTVAVILVIFVGIGLIVWAGGREVLAGRLSAGELSAFIFYALVVAGATGAIGEVIGDLLRGLGAAERLFELLATPREVNDPPVPARLARPRGEIRMQGVRFSYPTRPHPPALLDIDLQVAPGERVALVGPSGAGKSTLLQLILRFYDPDAGSIRLDGHPLPSLTLAQLRAHIALVPQEPVLFATTVAENIRYGCTGADEAAVRAAAAAAYAEEFIERLPEGLETPLGERGVQLSGGQRQRIAIARALLRDPALLLLDEATSALDAYSERQVQAALARLLAGRTSLVIAHRLATVVTADRIVMLQHGRIVASGPHERLLRECPAYAELAALQLAPRAGQGGARLTADAG